MKKRLNQIFVFILGFVVSIALVAFYRYQTVFSRLCNQMTGSQIPGSSMGMTCPGFTEVLVVTALSPLYFLISALIGVAAVLVVSKYR